MISTARSCGYISMEDVIRTGHLLQPGSKVYAQTKGKAVMFIHIGLLPIEEGMNILGAHIDSPRLDIKPNPMYEDTELAYLDTHYYGGIKNISGWRCRWHSMAPLLKRMEVMWKLISVKTKMIRYSV